MFKPVKAFLLRDLTWNFRTKLFLFCAAAGLSFPIWRLLLLLGHEGPPVSCLAPDLLLMAPFFGAAGLPLVSLSLIKAEPLLAGLGLLLSAGAVVALFVIPMPF